MRKGGGQWQGHRQDTSPHFPSPVNSERNLSQGLCFLIQGGGVIFPSQGRDLWAVGCAVRVRDGGLGSSS